MNEHADSIDDLFDDGPSMSFEEALAQLEAEVGIEGNEEDQPEAEAHDVIGELEDDAEVTDEEEEAEEEDEAEDSAEEDEEVTDEEEEEEEPAPDPLKSLYEEINSAFEDVNVSSPEELVAAYRAERESNDTMVGVFESYPELLDVVKEIVTAQKGGQEASLSEIVHKHFSGYFEAPDPAEDPEGYRKYLLQQGRLDAMRENERRRAAEAEQKAKAAAELADSALQDFAKERGWDDKALAGFREEIAELFAGDPRTGLPRKDFPAILWRGLHFDEAVKEAEKRGEVKGKTEAHRQHKNRSTKKGDGIAKLRSSRVESAPSEPVDNEAAQLAKELRSYRDDPLGDLIGRN